MKFNVEIKICGINSCESAEASIGAEYIGFVFYPKSPRFLNAFDAKEIASYLNPTQKKVGLFVNADINVIKHISDFINLDMIQLHGDETIEDIKIINLKNIKNSVTDYFVLATGNSNIHIDSIAEGIEEDVFKKFHEIPWSKEGKENP